MLIFHSFVLVTTRESLLGSPRIWATPCSIHLRWAPSVDLCSLMMFDGEKNGSINGSIGPHGEIYCLLHFVTYPVYIVSTWSSPNFSGPANICPYLLARSTQKFLLINPSTLSGEIYNFSAQVQIQHLRYFPCLSPFVYWASSSFVVWIPTFP